MEGGTSEFMPTGVGEVPQITEKPIIVAQPEPQVEKPNPLIARMAEIRASAHAHSEKALGLLSDQSISVETPQINANDAGAQLEALVKDESISPAEFLSKSREVLAVSKQVRSKAAADQEELNETSMRPYFAKREIDKKLEALNQARGLKKIPAAFERRRLISQKVVLEAQLNDLHSKIEAKQQIVDQLSQGESIVRLKQQELLLEEIGKEIQAVRVEYEKLAHEIQENGVTTAEIKDAYIKQVIAPQVERIAEEKKYPDKRKAEFYSALRTYINHRNDPEEQRQVYRQELDKFFDYNTGFYDAKNACDTLLRGGDEQIVQGFVVNMAAAEIRPIKEAADQWFNNRYEQGNRFSSIFDKAIEPADGWQSDEHSFNTRLLGKFKGDGGLSPYEDMNWWNALKSSKSAKELFGESIRQSDIEMYATAMDKSLSDTDGKDIEMLYYYPTPDAIRNLVILAAADNLNYRTVHANWTLDNLSKRPEWRQLLDKAEKTHPSLKTARETLENWNYREYATHPDIKRVAADVAASLFEDKNIDKRLTTLATLSLQNDAIVNILAKRGVINEQEQNSIVQAITFLRSTSEKTWLQYKESDYKTSYISDHYFNDGLRDNLLSLLQTEGGPVDSQKLEVIKRFDTVSKLVLENKSDFVALNYLISDPVLRRLKDPSIPITDLPAFLNAYKTVPALVRDSTLLNEFCKQFEGNRSVTFFKEVVAAYPEQEKQLDSIVTLVGNGKISHERALQLPVIATDVLSSPSFYLAVDNPKLFLETDENLNFFRKLTVEYRNQSSQLQHIVQLIADQKITQERALELPALLGEDILDDKNFEIAVAYPKLFLETNDGVLFLQQVRRGNLFTLDQDLEMKIGERIRTLQSGKDLQLTDLLARIVPGQLEQIDRVLASGQTVELSQLNWQQLLMGFVRSNSEIYGLPKLSPYSTEKINALFNDPKIRDACLSGLRDQWVTYLKSGKPGEIPLSLNLMSEFINYCGGAGPLSQINSLNTLINSVNRVFTRETTAERTKLEISQGLISMEERFAREKWSNEDKTDFYNISRDIISAAPSIFSDYLNLFGKLSPAQLKEFASDIYPLYRTKLVLMERKNKKGAKSFGKDQLIDMRRDIRNFADVFDTGKEAFDAQKTKLRGEITSLFKERFGIIKIPESFTPEYIRSFTNISTYLANLNARTPEKETILGFYLSMMINNRWNDYRKGVEINPDELLVPEKSEYIKRFLQERQRLNPLTAKNLGLQPEEMPELLKLMQQETSNVVVGNIETIDVKLTNIILNLRGLENLDLYTDPLDKQRMRLLLDYGNKRIGSVVARMYQQLMNPAKAAQFTEEEGKIQARISQIMQENGLEMTPQVLKKHFQDGIKPLSMVVNLMSFVEETKAEPEIQSLKSLLEPSNEVIEIFKRLGEDFRPTSGAMALSQDLSYLDNLVVKREDELRPEEKTMITEYTSRIREQVVKLESIYSQIKNKVGGLKQGSTTTASPLLNDELNQIDKIINAQTTQQAITSTTTDNLNTIIENIRKCLSCTREGCHNDTNLTFGDLNKFYLYSQSETQRQGSISDELVFVEPITRADGSQGMAFVLDKIYGMNTPLILENQIDAVLKKHRAIKQRFPHANLFVFVSDAAITTGGTSADMLLEKFRVKNIPGQIESVEVNVVKSATGDHYVEFGGGARTAGKRQVKGILFSI